MVTTVDEKTSTPAPATEVKAPSKVLGKFTYVGDPNDDFSGPSRITVRGVTFVKDEPKLVTDESLHRIFRGHSHFVEGVAKPKVEPKDPEEIVEALRVECRNRNIKFDRHDGVTQLKQRLGMK